VKVFYEGAVEHRFNKTLNRDFTVFDKGDCLLWELTQGEGTLIDYEDFEALLPFIWRTQCSRKGIYAMNSHATGMHTIIGGTEIYQVDHKSRNGLDNRRSNLRFANKEQQMFNRVLVRENESCEYRGVQLRTDRDLYRVVVKRLGDTRCSNLLHTKCPLKGAYAWDEFMYEEYKNHDPLKGFTYNNLHSEPTINFIQFNFPERLGL